MCLVNVSLYNSGWFQTQMFIPSLQSSRIIKMCHNSWLKVMDSENSVRWIFKQQCSYILNYYLQQITARCLQLVFVFVVVFWQRSFSPRFSIITKVIHTIYWGFFISLVCEQSKEPSEYSFPYRLIYRMKTITYNLDWESFRMISTKHLEEILWANKYFTSW